MHRYRKAIVYGRSVGPIINYQSAAQPNIVAYASSSPPSWRTQSQSNPSPLPNSLLTGKLTGNFAKSWLLARQRLQIMASLLGIRCEFPTQRNRELFS